MNFFNTNIPPNRTTIYSTLVNSSSYRHQESGLVRRNLFCFQLLGCLVALAPADTWLSVAYPPHFNFSLHFAPNHTGQPPGPPRNSPVEDCYQVNSHEADPVDEVGGGGDVD